MINPLSVCAVYVVLTFKFLDETLVWALNESY